MRYTQLNSGELSKYTALGQDGTPIYPHAVAFLESLKKTSELGPKVAEYFAIPKFSPDNSYVDWYIPFESSKSDGSYSISYWNATTNEEKQKALQELKVLEEKLTNFGQELEFKATNQNMRLLAHFLTGSNDKENLPVVHHPSNDCVFIVDGRPVITFWSFVKKGEHATTTPFKNLQSSTSSSFNSSSNAYTNTIRQETVTNTVVKERNHKPCKLALLWLLGLLGLLLLLWLLWQLLKFFFPSLGLSLPGFNLPNFNLPGFNFGNDKAEIDINAPDIDSNTIDLDKDVVAIKDQDKVAIDTIDPNVALTNDGGGVNTTIDNSIEDPLLDNDNTVSPDDNIIAPVDDGTEIPQDNEILAPVQVDDTPTTPTDPVDSSLPTNNNVNVADPVAMPFNNQALTKGDQSWLKGSWDTKSGLMDDQNGVPLNLGYEFDGKGNSKMIVTRKNGTKCVVNGTSKVNNGTIIIQSNANAVCPDGRSYAMPTITCTDDGTGHAKCKGKYDNSSEFNINMFKNSNN